MRLLAAHRNGWHQTFWNSNQFDCLTVDLVCLVAGVSVAYPPAVTVTASSVYSATTQEQAAARAASRLAHAYAAQFCPALASKQSSSPTHTPPTHSTHDSCLCSGAALAQHLAHRLVRPLCPARLLAGLATVAGHLAPSTQAARATHNGLL
jgi:hypothetical protein